MRNYGRKKIRQTKKIVKYTASSKMSKDYLLNDTLPNWKTKGSYVLLSAQWCSLHFKFRDVIPVMLLGALEAWVNVKLCHTKCCHRPSFQVLPTFLLCHPSSSCSHNHKQSHIKDSQQITRWHDFAGTTGSLCTHWQWVVCRALNVLFSQPIVMKRVSFCKRIPTLSKQHCSANLSMSDCDLS